MRIKKKAEVKPFRQTMAYRLLLVLASFLIFLYTIYEMVSAYRVNNTIAFIIAAVAGVLASIGIFFNLDRARYIPIPERKRYR